MRYLDEYRDAGLARACASRIRAATTRRWTLMEICGGQTHTIMRYALESLLPEEIELVHGPGCPVCVTPVGMIDRAIAIASRTDVIFTSFGDMLRVPGSERDLLSVKAAGADVRVVYSPLDAVRIAAEDRTRNVVFFAVGFETTAPANALAVSQAHAQGLTNFSILCAHVLVPPAVEAILSSPGRRIQALLAAGHVCAVMGYEEYVPIAERYRVPIVVTGFEPLDLLQGILMAVTQLEEGRAAVENQYVRAVQRQGNVPAQQMMRRVFEIAPREWRGIGEIPQSGLRLRDEFSGHDAERRFPNGSSLRRRESEECIAGSVLQGTKKPHECPAFGTSCTPEHPLGAPMVSSEGACAAYIQYRPVPVR